MERAINGLIVRLSKRKNNEIADFARYKSEEQHDLMLISSGKIMEIDHIISELKVLVKYKSKNNYNS